MIIISIKMQLYAVTSDNVRTYCGLSTQPIDSSTPSNNFPRNTRNPHTIPHNIQKIISQNPSKMTPNIHSMKHFLPRVLDCTWSTKMISK